MNRRDMLQTLAVVPLAPVALGSAAIARADDAVNVWGFQAEKMIELPLRPGDEIVALHVFRDELWAATKYGEMYKLSYID